MTALTVRRYEPRDANAVWDLHERALRDVGAYDPEFAHLDTDLRNVRDAYLDAGGEFLVGVLGAGEGSEGDGDDDREVVAMGALQSATAVDHHESDPGAGVIRRMRVEPDLQRRGYGSRILAELEGRAPDLGFERLVLDTTPDQAAARGLYDSFGYAERRRVTVEEADQVMIYYGKEL